MPKFSIFTFKYSVTTAPPDITTTPKSFSISCSKISLIEVDSTDKIFTQPKNQKTEDYITGRFG